MLRDRLKREKGDKQADTQKQTDRQTETGTSKRQRSDVEEGEEKEILIFYPLQVHNLSPTYIFTSVTAISSSIFCSSSSTRMFSSSLSSDHPVYTFFLNSFLFFIAYHDFPIVSYFFDFWFHLKRLIITVHGCLAFCLFFLNK